MTKDEKTDGGKMKHLLDARETRKIKWVLCQADLNGGHEIIKDVVGVPYPLKTVVSAAGDTVTVITSYPLKKGRKK
jgi:hypothetical protein